KAPAEKWIAVFYRPYGDQEPSFRVYVDTQEALNTPIEKAYERLQAQELEQARQRTLEQQQEQNPVHKGPTLS
ncbi:MAG: hypothetical protein LBL59_05570, partial [Xanthomonadaceae bacterium]|nr:hypothetical protein [Xanthomonadaceae bacterium]